MEEYGIRKLHDSLKTKLSDYLKAQYFAKNAFMEQKATEILNIPDTIAQEPYIEAGKKYKSILNGFETAKISDEHKSIFKELLAKNLINPKYPPYVHQIKSIEHFQNGKDLLVTTGTGSGKTECFLWNIYSQLINEAIHKSSWEQNGVRVLLLYPMNALVSDQLGRIREVIGNEKFTEIIHTHNPSARIPRFGMYTGRTSYAGFDDPKKNKAYGKMLAKEFIDASEEKISALKEINRVPAKDMQRFVDNLLNGQQITGDSDTELFTRYEMQTICPDILITNYCMLEYMMMRPIEQSIWNNTRKWLEESEDNKLTIVLDEAHMYKGSSGGEVSLLVRRLMAHLKIGRDRIRFILTTASMPSDKKDEVIKFACNLSCQAIDRNNFEIITAEYESISGNAKGSDQDLKILNSIDYNRINASAPEILEEIHKLSEGYGWSIDDNNYQVDLYSCLSSLPVMLELIEVCGNKGKAFSEIADSLFTSGTKDDKETATEVLFALGAKAKSQSGQVLLSSKLHLLFKGFDGIYACLNKNCPEAETIGGITLGFVDKEMHYFCPHCHSRMFELVNDRRCGTLFVKSFVLKDDKNSSKKILWQTPGSVTEKVDEKHFWIVPDGMEPKDIFSPTSKERKTRDAKKRSSNFGYIHSYTGVLFDDDTYENNPEFIKVLMPMNDAFSFSTCPNCGKQYTTITNFATRGNEPFTNLSQEQLDCQPIIDHKLNNGGKKVLLFSDSRQKAATLAKDITRNSDITASRKAIFCAVKYIEEHYGTDYVKFELIYKLLLYYIKKYNLYFYYGNEGDLLSEHKIKMDRYCLIRDRRNKPYDFKDGFEDVDSNSIPDMFYKYMLKSFSDSFNSLQYLCLAEVVLSDANDNTAYEIDTLSNQLNISYQDLIAIFNAMIQQVVVDDLAIFPELNDEVRESIIPYERKVFGIELEKDGMIHISTYMRDVLMGIGLNDDKIDILRETFNHFLVSSKTNSNHDRKYLNSSYLTIKSGENIPWYHCTRCSGNASYTLFKRCIHCGSDKLQVLTEENDFKKYSFWRKPILDAFNGQPIKNIVTEEHTAQLSYKEKNAKMWATTEEYEMRFRNILLDADSLPIDILSCTTTMEVGIDIGKLIAVGLRNVPPMRENYQQRAGRAGRSGSPLSSIVTFTENGPHDAWYYEHPAEIISGQPRTPWIDENNSVLIYRHLNMTILEKYCLMNEKSLSDISALCFIDPDSWFYYNKIISYTRKYVNTLSDNDKKTLIPEYKNYDFQSYCDSFEKKLVQIAKDMEINPVKYHKYKEDIDSDDMLSIQDVFFKEGMLPTYSFPRNIVNFWIEDKYGKIVQSPERSIDLALNEYSPGKIVVVNKRSYVSGALYDHYTKYSREFAYKQAEPWLKMNEHHMIVYMCNGRHCGWVDIHKPEKMLCPMCNEHVSAKTMIKPWGFASVDAEEIPEARDDSKYSTISRPSYSSFPITDKMITVYPNVRVEPRYEQDMTIVNKGPMSQGFKLCSKCGAIVPTISQDKCKEAKRPYKILYKTTDDQKCSHNWVDTFLGYTFKTDMFVMEIEIDKSVLNIDNINWDFWLIPALTTLTEAFALSAAKVLDIEFTDIKSGYRIRRYNGRLYADVFLYDNLTSGAGYSVRVKNVLNEVFDDMEARLSNCNCEKSCPKCVRHFWNQILHDYLDRKCGLELLRWLRYDTVEKEVKRYDECIETISKIVDIYGSDYLLKIIDNEPYISHNNITKKISLYPAMLNNPQFEANVIAIPDKLCIESPAVVWEIINTKLQYT